MSLRQIIFCLIWFPFTCFAQSGVDSLSRFQKIGNMTVEYKDWGGSGSPLILLAGAGNTSDTFDVFAPHFTKNHRVIAPTRRGFGKSDKPTEGYDIGTLADDIRILMDSLKIKRASFIVHSFAGAEITALASRHPGYVERIIYLDALGDFREQAEIMLTSGDIPPFFKTRLSQALDSTSATDATSGMSEDEKFNFKLLRSSMSYKMTYGDVKAPVLAFFMTPKEHFAITKETSSVKKEEMNKWWTENGIPYTRKQIDKAGKDFKNIKILEMSTSDHFLHRGEKMNEVIDACKEFLAKEN